MSVELLQEAKKLSTSIKEKKVETFCIVSGLGERFFKSVAKEVKVDMSKLEKDLNSPKVMARIQEDLAEAKKYGFQGTPGFLINGIPVKGAYPPSHFDMIIEELKKRGKISL